MKNRHIILALILTVAALLLAILLHRQQSSLPATEAEQVRRPPESRAALQPGTLVGENQQLRRKNTFFGEEGVELIYKDARFMGASLIKKALENQASSRESIQREIAYILRTAWPNIYDAPLNVEFWELAFQKGIDRKMVQKFRRPSDNPADWPAWIEQIKQAQATGASLEPYRRELNRVFIVPSPKSAQSLLNLESPTRKSWEKPELQRIAALIDRMIEELEWPAWPEQPDWELITDEYIISEIPDMIDAAIEENEKREKRQLELMEHDRRSLEWNPAEPGSIIRHH